jgi:hypothetical protein
MSDLNFMLKDTDVEANKQKVTIRHMIFGLTTLLFIVITVFSIQDFFFVKKMQFSNIIYFLSFMFSIGLILATMIINLSKYSEIKKNIKFINEQNILRNSPPETFIYSKTLWIYPIVSFVYFIIIITYLIMLNHKCSIIKNNMVNNMIRSMYYRL